MSGDLPVPSAPVLGGRASSGSRRRLAGLAESREQLGHRLGRLAGQAVLAAAAGFLVLVLALDGGRCGAGSHGDSSEWTAVVSVWLPPCQPAAGGEPPAPYTHGTQRWLAPTRLAIQERPGGRPPVCFLDHMSLRSA